MACGSLSSGRTEPCKDFVGGIKAFYLIEYDADLVFNETDGLVASLSAASTAYQFDVRHASGFTTTINSSRETGTTFYETALAVTLKGINEDDKGFMETIMKKRPFVIVTDNNGTNFILGHEFGCEASGTFQTGSAMGELYGYNLTFTSQERRMPLMAGALSGVTDLTISPTQEDPAT